MSHIPSPRKPRLEKMGDPISSTPSLRSVTPDRVAATLMIGTVTQYGRRRPFHSLSDTKKGVRDTLHHHEELWTDLE